MIDDQIPRQVRLSGTLAPNWETHVLESGITFDFPNQLPTDFTIRAFIEMSDTDSSTRGVNRANMSAEDESERVTVRTYVPAYQREAWREHADELAMSTSEFLRTMVQAGIRDFDLGEEATVPVEPDRSTADPGGHDLEDRILAVLREEGHCSWDELVSALTEDIEDRLETTLEDLQNQNRVAHSARNGGYRVLEDE